MNMNVTSVSLQQAQIATVSINPPTKRGNRSLTKHYPQTQLQYSDVASVAVLIYDWFLTIDLELTLVWKAPWNLGTLLYILARYPTFIEMLPQLYRMLAISGVVAEVLVMVCVWAIWGKTRKMAIFLIILIIGAVATATVGLRSDQSSETHIAPGILPPNIPGCQVIPQGTHSMIYMDFLAVVILESVLLSLVLFKAVQHSRNYSSASFVSECFRHGLLYYVVLDGEFIIGARVLSQAVSDSSFINHEPSSNASKGNREQFLGVYSGFTPCHSVCAHAVAPEVFSTPTRRGRKYDDASLRRGNDI
ncbi:hypothetical protein BD779DRAFT_1672799 [Infundibulicybe gibba]|nr:hypothetical protein BD779DRAFT_1672799 [Infundibulicybe gibba]